ncbi:MAG TPA: TOBE domain-containing protein [Paracoccaceae bacterium]|nr:TOBE domain-containing protein [Paracoccaceae bacterium]
MQDELKAIQRQVGTTFVHVTHDQEEAMAIADRIVVMNAGRIEDEGAPARIYRQPATLFAAAFMGEMNRISGQAKDGYIQTAFARVYSPRTVSGPVTICLRPEAIRIGNTGFALGSVTVQDAAFFGTHCRAHVVPAAAPDLRLVVHLPPGDLPAAGIR